VALIIIIFYYPIYYLGSFNTNYCFCLPYYFGCIDPHYILLKNVEVFRLLFLNIKIFLKENVEYIQECNIC